MSDYEKLIHILRDSNDRDGRIIALYLATYFSDQITGTIVKRAEETVEEEI